MFNEGSTEEEEDTQKLLQTDSTVEEAKEEEIKTNIIYFVAEIVDSWCEISRQFIEFPDTPMGSYSIMYTEINAFNQSSINECVCGYLKTNRADNFECHFKIFGGSSEIMVEPTCGELKCGEVIKKFKKSTLRLLLSSFPNMELIILKSLFYLSI